MITSSHNDPCLSMPSNLTVRAITTAHGELLDFIGKHAAATIAVESDAQVDISFIQMIEAARIFAGTQGKTLSLARPADGALLDVLQRSGFTEGMSAEDAQFWLHQGTIQ